MTTSLPPKKLLLFILLSIKSQLFQKIFLVCYFLTSFILLPHFDYFDSYLNPSPSTPPPPPLLANKQWHSLRELHLDANSLPPLTTHFLPLSPSLTHLSLGANQLPHFPSLCPPPPSSFLPLSLSSPPSPFPFLRVLSLAANKIQIIPEELGRLEGLEEVSLGENQIEEIGENCLPKSLKILRVQSNQLEVSSVGGERKGEG